MAQVVRINRLDSNGRIPRADIEAAFVDNRIVIFDVAGRVDLSDAQLFRDNPRNLYVFGNTAPGCVQFYGYPLNFDRPRQLRLQGVTIRASYETTAPLSHDCLKINNYCRNVDIVRCSMAGGHDEVMQVYSPPGKPACENMTVTQCLIGPGYRGIRGHNHSALINCRNFKWHRNACVHNARRQPQLDAIDVNGPSEVVESLVYNYGTQAIALKQGVHLCRGNVVIPGPQTRVSRPSNWPADQPWTGEPAISIVENETGSATIILDRNRREAFPQGQHPALYGADCFQNVEPNFTADVRVVESPDEGETWDPLLNLDQIGNRVDDGWDARFRDDVRNRTGSWIDHPSEIGGVPDVPGVERAQPLDLPDLPQAELLAWLAGYVAPETVRVG